MNYLIIVPSIIIFFCIIKVFNSKRKQKISIETQNKIVPMINKKPIKKNTKKVNEGLVVLSRPNKCFSCEKQMLKHSATKNIHLAFPGKCFDCEKHSKTPYHEGPTKCFSCIKN